MYDISNQRVKRPNGVRVANSMNDLIIDRLEMLDRVRKNRKLRCARQGSERSEDNGTVDRTTLNNNAGTVADKFSFCLTPIFLAS